MEVQRPECRLDARRAPARLHLRGHLPPAYDHEGPQPRHRLVCHARQRMAGTAPRLQICTRMATEAQYLLARHVFDDLGYRRYEWKCNALNAASMRAARRLGFTFEGIFRQHMIMKGRNRDTAWFAMLDSEWPGRRLAFRSARAWRLKPSTCSPATSSTTSAIAATNGSATP